MYMQVSLFMLKNLKRYCKKDIPNFVSIEELDHLVKYSAWKMFFDSFDKLNMKFKMKEVCMETNWNHARIYNNSQYYQNGDKEFNWNQNVPLFGMVFSHIMDKEDRMPICRYSESIEYVINRAIEKWCMKRFKTMFIGNQIPLESNAYDIKIDLSTLRGSRDKVVPIAEDSISGTVSITVTFKRKKKSVTKITANIAEIVHDVNRNIKVKIAKLEKEYSKESDTIGCWNLQK